MPSVLAADAQTITFLTEILISLIAIATAACLYLLLRTALRPSPKQTVVHTHPPTFVTPAPLAMSHQPDYVTSMTSIVATSSAVRPHRRPDHVNVMSANEDGERPVPVDARSGAIQVAGDRSPRAVNDDAEGLPIAITTGENNTGTPAANDSGKSGEETLPEKPDLVFPEVVSGAVTDDAVRQPEPLPHPAPTMPSPHAPPVHRPGSHFVSLNLEAELPRRNRSVTLAPEVIEESATARILGVPVTQPTMNGDVECGEADTETLSARAASLRGISHRLDGKPRQDSYSLSVHKETGAIVAIVGDGVSQANSSDLGSRLAVTLMAEAIHASLDRDPCVSAQAIASKLGTLSNALVARANTFVSGIVDRALATTLVAVIDDGHRVRIVQVGDSPVWALANNGKWTNLVAGPAEGAVRDSRTACIPLHPDQAVTRDIERPDGVIVVMSDGVSDPLGSGNSATGRYLAERFSSPPDPLQFALDLSFEARGFSDDRTAIAIWATNEKVTTKNEVA